MDWSAVVDNAPDLAAGLLITLRLSLISACTALEDVEVLWISRYGAGSNLTRDLEVVEAMTSAPDLARDTLVDLIPATNPEGGGCVACPGT